jgi:plastocyanin
MRHAGLIAACITVCACSKPTPPASTGAAAVPPSATVAGATAGSVTGRINSTSAAVVVLEPKTARTFAAPGETPVMDQVGLMFGPELLLVRTGYPVEFRNSDDTLHNVRVSHEETRTSAFNVAIPTGEKFVYTFERDGFYRVGCDIHPAMAASVFASASPFTAVAASDGSFMFDDVPTGAWTVTVYTGGKRLHHDVDVAGGASNVTIE